MHDGRKSGMVSAQTIGASDHHYSRNPSVNYFKVCFSASSLFPSRPGLAFEPFASRFRWSGQDTDRNGLALFDYSSPYGVSTLEWLFLNLKSIFLVMG